MPDLDLSYIDDELAANAEYVTWHGSEDSADSTDVDPRLDDDATGSFDYYGTAPLMVRTMGGHTASFTVAAGSVNEDALRMLFGLPPRDEPNFDCPPIPGPADPVARVAHRQGLDGYAARAWIADDWTRVVAAATGIGAWFRALTEAVRPVTAAIAQLGTALRPAARRSDYVLVRAAPAGTPLDAMLLNETHAIETVAERALRLRRERNTGPALPGMDGRRRRG